MFKCNFPTSEDLYRRNCYPQHTPTSLHLSAQPKLTDITRAIIYIWYSRTPTSRHLSDQPKLTDITRVIVYFWYSRTPTSLHLSA